MAAHGTEQTKRGAGHMAVVTAAARRVFSMMRVAGHVRRHRFVALQTGGVRIHFRF